MSSSSSAPEVRIDAPAGSSSGIKPTLTVGCGVCCIMGWSLRTAVVPPGGRELEGTPRTVLEETGTQENLLEGARPCLLLLGSA